MGTSKYDEAREQERKLLKELNLKDMDLEEKESVIGKKYLEQVRLLKFKAGDVREEAENLCDHMDLETDESLSYVEIGKRYRALKAAFGRLEQIYTKMGFYDDLQDLVRGSKKK